MLTGGSDEPQEGVDTIQSNAHMSRTAVDIAPRDALNQAAGTSAGIRDELHIQQARENTNYAQHLLELAKAYDLCCLLVPVAAIVHMS